MKLHFLNIDDIKKIVDILKRHADSHFILDTLKDGVCIRVSTIDWNLLYCVLLFVHTSLCIIDGYFCSETLGTELGLYEHATDKFGQLSMEAIRCCRLVVDTGMHSMGWSQEEAVQFMLKNTAMGEHDARTEVARYITWPGQACAYKVGERFIRKMRTLAETELGEAFDPRDFYDVVLLCGAVPLDVLEELVEEYIANAKNPTEASAAPGKELGRDEFLASMSFANWCKCCIVPGSCKS